MKMTRKQMVAIENVALECIESAYGRINNINEDIMDFFDARNYVDNKKLIEDGIESLRAVNSYNLQEQEDTYKSIFHDYTNIQRKACIEALKTRVELLVNCSYNITIQENEEEFLTLESSCRNCLEMLLSLDYFPKKELELNNKVFTNYEIIIISGGKAKLKICKAEGKGAK